MSENMQRRGGGPMGGPPHRMGLVTEKPKNFKATFAKLIRYSRKFIPSIIIALLLATFGTVLQIIGPDKLKDLTNEVAKGLPRLIEGVPVAGAIDMSSVWSIVILLSCFYLGALLLIYTESFIMATTTQKISKQMRSDISKKINRLPLSYFYKTSYGDILSRVTNDVDSIGQSLNQSVATLVTATTLFVGSLVMMFYTNWIMSLTAIASSLVGFVIMILIMQKSQKYFAAGQAQLGNINGQIEEKYTGHNVVKLYNGGRQMKKSFEEVNTKLYTSGWKSQFFSGLMMPLMSFVGNFGYVAVCVVGAVLVFNGTISFGVIVAFMIYVRLFTQPLSQFAQVASNLQRTAAASERVFEFLEEKEIEDESQKLNRLSDVRGAVDFKNIRFGYIPGKTVINNFSASIKAGQKVAIVGPTGAGKTTIVNLLMRFYEIDEGEILLDGTPINSVPRENIHEQFCMVLQDTWLFEGSVKENIIYSEEGVSDDEVVEACKAVGMHHFIQTLPNGYDTILSDKSTLSEGEKQLLTIARAIIKNSPILILDEATSSVDTRTERRVQMAMDRLMKNRTSFVIAHRLSTIKNADIILVMRDGDIVESGNHKQLLEKQGFYAELYNSQFERKTI